MRQQSVYLFGLAILLAIIYICSAQNFYSSGGRYGKRTLETPALQDTKLHRRSSRVWGRGSGEIQQIAPRAQFFLGSRYGKRTISDNGWFKSHVKRAIQSFLPDLMKLNDETEMGFWDSRRG